MYNIYIGYDSREAKGYDIAKYSIEKNTKNPDVRVLPLIQKDLRDKGIYTRRKDELASTEFSFTRFLVPHLNKHKGFAIFMDSDMLITRDIMEAFERVDKSKAVSVVKHNYIPKTSVKMDNQVQRAFPKKNWSSFIVFNCEHPYNKQLTAKLVNEGEPKFLHCFEWLTKHDIGELPREFNFLIGEYDKPAELPFNLHWTLGSPELLPPPVEYEEIWWQYHNEAYGKFSYELPFPGKIPEQIIHGEVLDVPLYPVGPQRAQPSSEAKINAEVTTINRQLDELSAEEKERIQQKVVIKEFEVLKKN